jgi:hypothetical protein
MIDFTGKGQNVPVYAKISNNARRPLAAIVIVIVIVLQPSRRPFQVFTPGLNQPSIFCITSYPF